VNLGEGFRDVSHSFLTGQGMDLQIVFEIGKGIKAGEFQKVVNIHIYL
jgi:hypothetical protein